MNDRLAPGAPLVLDLLNYIEQVEKLKTKPAFSVPTEFFVAYQHELKGLPELQFNLQVDGDDVWLRLPRLQEIAAPEPDEDLKPWVTLPKEPREDARTQERGRHLRRQAGGRRASSLKDHPEIQRGSSTGTSSTSGSPGQRPSVRGARPLPATTSSSPCSRPSSSEGAETPLELVWGIGYAAWKKEGFATPVKYPLLVQPCEVTLNEKTFDLEVRPRDVEPRLEADCYAEMELPGVKQLEAFWRSALATGANRVNPFEASTFEGTLKAAVGHLDPSGAYEVRTDDVTSARAERQAQDHEYLGALWTQALWRHLPGRHPAPEEEGRGSTALPSVIRSFVEHGDSTVRVRPEQPFRGLSTSDGGSSAMELYFPMAYNDEQVSIVQKLHTNDGVVVQGPPGTGKTHTIANVICHYLAQGKRVLVTAKGESALAVLQEKLPERIRPLSVALLSDERDGMKQFEHSIQTIASSVASINPTRAAANIAAAEEKLNQLHAKISHVDRTVCGVCGQAHAELLVPRQGRHARGDGQARAGATPKNTSGLTTSRRQATDGKLPFNDDDINALRRARMRVGEDLVYLGCSLPAPDAFPAWADLLGLHRDLVTGEVHRRQRHPRQRPALVDSRLETFEKAQALVKFLDDRLGAEGQAGRRAASPGWTP